MDRSHHCCDRRTLEGFLADRLAAGAAQALETHLESCPTCREQLDHLAAEPGWWREAQGYLSSGVAGEDAPPLAAAAGEAVGDDVLPPIGGLDLYLAPTDDPRMLGRVGTYEIAGLVGCGGMGIVLKAFDAALNRYVAIKVLAPHLALSAAARKRFAREAKAAAAVVHDNVVAIHAVADARGMPYFVMPYIRGVSLEKRLQQTGALGVVEVLRIGMQIADGLAAAHAQGLVHRDIKPANILLEDGVERVTLTDFGLARAVDDASLTQSGVLAGTPQYMSPEQAGGRAVDHRSDLFSLGSVLYALCTGRPPFRADSTLAVLRRVEEDTPRPIREINPDVPEWLAAVIERLHAKDPADRFASAAEVAALLRGYLAHVQKPTVVAPPELPRMPASARRGGTRPATGTARPGTERLTVRTVGLLAAVVVAVLGGALAALFFWPFDRRQPVVSGPQEYLHTFSDRPESRAGVQLLGPDAEKCVTFEPGGLRITVPAGYDGPPGFFGERPDTGVVVPVRVSGNFEITVAYEILDEPAPADAGKPQTRFTLDVGFDRENNAVATASRRVEEKGGTQYFAWVRRWDAETGKAHTKGRGVAAHSKVGRLRIQREGPTLSYHVADGKEGPFVLLAQYPVGAGDPEDLRLSASTGGPRAALDVRVFDIQIRADSVTDLADHGAGGVGTWPALALAAVAVAAVAGGAALVARRAVRHSTSAPVAPDANPSTDATSAPIVFPCSGCGKKLRVRGDLAGRRIKCPQCGGASTAIRADLPPGRG
jgi:hypothetical protein